MRTKEKEKLEAFLESYGALNKFKNNIESGGRFSSYASFILRQPSCSGAIDNALHWRETPEGHGYWSELNSLLHRHIKEGFKNLEPLKYKSIW